MEVDAAKETDSPPSEDTFEASRVPKSVVTDYRAMYAHGIHFRILSAEEDEITCDSGIAACVWQQDRGANSLSSAHLTRKPYFGWIKEILELDYKSHCCVVLVCSWIYVDVVENSNKIVRDRYGFVLGNFTSPIPLGPASFAFPTQCKQVFFYNDSSWNSSRGGDWKVIIGTQVRERRVAEEDSRPDIAIMKVGWDSKHEGLQAP
jgi:hypothetical protein